MTEGAPESISAVSELYEELRKLAHQQLVREPGNPTLHTTELVHEAYLRFGDDERLRGRGRAYFFGAAAQAMRRVLIDAARRRTALKRGGSATNITFGDQHAAVDSYAAELLDLDRALTEIEQEKPRLTRVVELRFFGGLSVEETAEALEVSPRTVKSDWAEARHRLRDLLSLDADSDGGGDGDGGGGGTSGGRGVTVSS